MPPFTTFLTRNNVLKTLSVWLVLSSVMTAPVVQATPCLAFDSDFNLYALGFGGKDFKLGTQDQWSSQVSPTDITASNRPPFDGPQTTCYLAQFFNAIYVLDGDKSDPTSVYIYDVASQSWSKQLVATGGPDPNTLTTILDHDTNVFYAYDNGTMFHLDMGEMKTANATAISWAGVGQPGFDTTNYNPTMALAQNHIHFIGVPNAPAGDAFIFVIHFSFFQPAPQDYPVDGGGNPFPSTHGQTASIFKTEGVQEEFAFIPDDASATYVINVDTNSTLPLAAPTDKSSSTFTASTSALVQLTNSGSIYFLPYTPGNADQSKAATWAKMNVQGLPSVSSSSSGAGGGTSGSSNGTTGTTGGSAPGGVGSSGGSNGTNASGNNSGASSLMTTMISTIILPMALLFGSLPAM